MKCRILVVDDSSSIHLYVQNFLALSSECEVICVNDGAQAIAMLKTDSKFDLILLDWEMPKMDGPGVVETMQKMNIHIPTVMMTARNKPEDVVHMLNRGVVEYMMKPFTIDILFDKIERASGKSVTYEF
jgi:two-component system chemotaxis response regulator CheY